MKALLVMGAVLVYGTNALNQGTIKSKLAQMKNLAELEAEQANMPALTFNDLHCPCSNLTSGSGLPAPGGAAQTQVFNNGALVSQGTEVKQIPNTAQIQNCNAKCCACNAAQEASMSQASKIRHFNISGSIEVSESVNFSEMKTAEEQSLGESEKSNTCTTQNQNGGSGAAPGGGCVSVCLANSNVTV